MAVEVLLPRVRLVSKIILEKATVKTRLKTAQLLLHWIFLDLYSLGIGSVFEERTALPLDRVGGLPICIAQESLVSSA